jgi:predicted MFS family arabinose efflux permease
MSLCVAMLIAAEFMPVSLLTPIAASLDATEGQAGQAIGISGIFAVAASLAIASFAGRIDRKRVLLAMTTLMLVSLILIAVAPNFPILMIARACLGISIGGFWSLSTAVIMRLVPANEVPKALAMMFAGQASAVAFAAPIGSYLGEVIGWRGVFWCLVPIVLANLVWQFLALPTLPAREGLSFRKLLLVASLPYVSRALFAVLATFGGAFAMFTYLRPFLESVTGVEPQTLSLLLLALGCAGFIGTWAGGRLSQNHVMALLRFLPFAMAAVTLALLGFGQVVAMVAVLLAFWGIINTALPISWMAWVTQEVGEQAEAAGGLMVATIQFAILMGATIGGSLLDHMGITATFIASACLLTLAALLVGTGKALRASR